MCSREARSCFVPSLPQTTLSLMEKVQLILSHNRREGERVQLIPLGGHLEAVDGWGFGGGGGSRGMREGHRGWPGLS